MTSTISLTEILTKPLVDKNFTLVDEIKFALKTFSTLSMVAIDEKLAEAAALMRARHAIRLPDALQIAAAIQGEATLFVTNDKRLKSRSAGTVRLSLKLGQRRFCSCCGHSAFSNILVPLSHRIVAFMSFLLFVIF